MNDIQLTRNGTDTGYDWNFNGLDLVSVNGEQQIVNAIMHNILLRNNELSQEIYKDKGCSVYDNIPLIDNSISRDMLTEILKTSIEEVEGVREAKIGIEIMEGQLNIKELRVTLKTGKEVKINGI